MTPYLTFPSDVYLMPSKLHLLISLCARTLHFIFFFFYLFEKHFDERITYHIKDKTNKQTTESITTPFSGKSTQVSRSVMCSVLNLVIRCCVFLGADPPFLQNLGCTIFALCTVIYYYICACDSTKTGENVARQSTR